VSVQQIGGADGRTDASCVFCSAPWLGMGRGPTRKNMLEATTIESALRLIHDALGA